MKFHGALLRPPAPRTLSAIVWAPYARGAYAHLQITSPARDTQYYSTSPEPEVEFLEEIQTEVLRVFLLAIHRHLY